MAKIKGKRLVIIMLLLCVFGMIMIYSASMYTAEIRYGDKFYFVKKQFIGFILGVVGFLSATMFDYHKLFKFRWWVIGVSVVLLALVFVPGIGITSNGARRWIGVGGFSLQSSEVAKFGFVVFSASYLAQNHKTMKKFSTVLPLLAVGGIVCLLVLLEPNLSVTLCIGMVLIGMLFLGGISLKHFLWIAIPALALVPVLIVVEPYRLSRLMAFINPWANPKEEGFQLIQSLYSLGGGGLFGVGLFNSRQKYLFLPFSESDFIFSVIGEEWGFVGCLILCIVYLLFILEGVKIAYRAKDRFGTYLAGGITMLIATQLLINIAVVTGSIPPTGIPLPFISAGGTSLSVFMTATGVLCNVANNTKTSQFLETNVFEKEKRKLFRKA